MKLISVNISLPIDIEIRGKNISTGIYKQPVAGPVTVNKLNLAGDGQADLKHHGGEDKAAYAYSHDHYPYWQNLLGSDDLPMGTFGENLTITDLDERQLHIGDHLKIGSALFAITQPRVPCYKLAARIGDPDLPQKFIKSGFTGVYLKILEEGAVQSGDEVTVTKRDEAEVSVRALFDAYYNSEDTQTTLFNRALGIDDLSLEWRNKLESLLR